ncbi:hypothetical protein [Streptomyces sp. NBC_00388]|uniref:hypothetical protein n=1 Tax=Streptomyces sp. NBC_00388 TaxID=2975735 RepID=UPI002E21317A
MSDTQNPSTAAAVGTGTGKNRSAKISAFFALAGVASLGSFYTAFAWINPGVYVSMAVLCALIAIPTGHIGRFRGRRLPEKDGRGVALLAILVSWLVLLVCLLAGLAYFGLMVGLAYLSTAL